MSVTSLGDLIDLQKTCHHSSATYFGRSTSLYSCRTALAVSLTFLLN